MRKQIYSPLTYVGVINVRPRLVLSPNKIKKDLSEAEKSQNGRMKNAEMELNNERWREMRDGLRPERHCGERGEPVDRRWGKSAFLVFMAGYTVLVWRHIGEEA